MDNKAQENFELNGQNFEFVSGDIFESHYGSYLKHNSSPGSYEVFNFLANFSLYTKGIIGKQEIRIKFIKLSGAARQEIKDWINNPLNSPYSTGSTRQSWLEMLAGSWTEIKQTGLLSSQSRSPLSHEKEAGNINNDQIPNRVKNNSNQKAWTDISPLDRKILAVQKSTKTLLPAFNKIHNWLRAKSRLYYNWHLNAWHNFVHWAVVAVEAAVVITLIAGTFLTTLTLNTKRASAAATNVWDFSTAGEYTYDSDKIEFSNGAAQLKAAGGAGLGSGADGAITVSSGSNLNTNNLISGRSCADGGDAVNYSVTALTTSTATLSSTPSAGCLSAGNEILLINLQGTASRFDNVGNFETLRIQSVSANTVTFSSGKSKYYGDNTTDDTNIGTTSDNQKVLLQRVPNYTNMTVNNEITLTASDWDGTRGGVIFFRANGTITVNGAIGTSGKGYRGGNTDQYIDPNAMAGESVSGAGSLNHVNNAGGGGGGNRGDAQRYSGAGGGGGSYGTAGGKANDFVSPSDHGVGGFAGATYGSASLDKLYLGSGGGQSANANGASTGTGGDGGGIVYIAGGTLSLAAISNNGNNGGNGNGGSYTAAGGGGGGAGGSVRLSGTTISLTTVTATGGNGGTAGVDTSCCPLYYKATNGAAGGGGRVAVYSPNSITGTSTPSYDAADAENSYPADQPTIVNKTAHQYSSITAFTEVLGSGSSGSIQYQISPDSGSTWYWWNGSAWMATAGSYANSNTASVINAKIALFSAGTAPRQFIWRAYLNSDGKQLPKIDYLVLGSGQSWDFSSSGDYTLSDSGSIQVADGVANLKDQGTLPTGSGDDGSITVADNKNINADNLITGRVCADGGDAVNYSVAALTGNSATLAASPSTGCLTAGDEVLLINLQGTAANFGNVGNYETLIIDNISDDTITFTSGKSKHYGDGTSDDTNIGTAAGNQKVVLQRVPNYINVTVNNGMTLTAGAWDGTKGGVMFFRASGTATINGTINMSGNGFRGGNGGTNGCNNYPYPATAGDHGESYNGSNSLSDCDRRATITGHKVAVGANGGGGGGGGASYQNAARNGGGGGGASYGVAATGGSNSSTGENGAAAGATYGASDLSKIFLGSGGGGGGRGVNSNGGNGGAGGGIIQIIAGTLTNSGSIFAKSNNGTKAVSSDDGGGGGGGGAGGSIRIVGNSLTLGSAAVSAIAGSGGNGSSGGDGGYGNGGNGGNGGTGRIAVYSPGAVSGTTSPDYGTALLDGSYPIDNPSVINNTALNYSSLSGFSVAPGANSAGTTRFQLSPDSGTSWYWWNGSSWTAASNSYSESDTAADINSNISTLPAGSGELKFRAYLQSDSLHQTEINAVTVYYYAPPSAPTMTAAGNIAVNSIRWNWTDQSVSERSFNLYDADDNSLIGTVASTTTLTTGQSYYLNESGLSPNVRYSRYVKANDADEDGSASATAAVYTLANAPSAPMVVTVSSISMSLAINQNSNPAGTEFAFGLDQNNNGAVDTDSWVQTDGSLGASEFWRTYAQWGGSGGMAVTGLTPNSQYRFIAKARNGDETETAFSTASTLTRTYAATPLAPTVTPVNSTTLKIVINGGANPSDVEYVIYNETVGKYLKQDGTFSGSAVWAARADWNGSNGSLNISLIENTIYSFKVKARNADDIESAFSDNADRATPISPVPPASVSLLDVSDTTKVNFYQLSLQWDEINNAAFDYFIIERSIDDSAFSSVTTTANQYYIDSDLDSTKTYAYRIRTHTDVPDVSVPSMEVSGRPGAAPVISNLEVGSIGLNSATITWTTNMETDSVIEYGKTIIYGQVSGSSDLVTSHSVILSGLELNSLYHFRIKATASTNSFSYSSDRNFTTGLSTDLAGNLEISNIAAVPSAGDATVATIGWVTNKLSTSKVLYGITDSLGSETSESTTSGYEHFVSLASLTAGTTYYYKVESKDALGNAVASDVDTLTTKVLTSSRPSVSSVAVSDVSLNSAIISWKTNIVTSSIVSIGTTDSYGFNIEDQSTGVVTIHTIKAADLNQGTVYHFRVKGRSSDGVEIASDNYTFATLTLPVITNVKYKDVDSRSAAVIWETNIETDSYVDYGLAGSLDQSQGKSDSVKSHKIVLTNLNPATVYSFKAKSRDKYGNSVESPIQTFQTTIDTTPPIIKDMKAETSTINGANGEVKAQAIISWSTDESSTSQIQYSLGVAEKDSYQYSTEKNETLTNSHIVVISNLLPSATYHLRAISEDEAGNISVSDDYTVLTLRQDTSLLQYIIQILEERFSWLKELAGGG